jgi:hypothetical protein
MPHERLRQPGLAATTADDTKTFHHQLLPRMFRCTAVAG